MVKASRDPSDEAIAAGLPDEAWPGRFLNFGIQHVYYAKKTDKFYHWLPVCGEPRLEQPLNSKKKVVEYVEGFKSPSWPTAVKENGLQLQQDENEHRLSAETPFANFGQAAEGFQAPETQGNADTTVGKTSAQTTPEVDEERSESAGIDMLAEAANRMQCALSEAPETSQQRPEKDKAQLGNIQRLLLGADLNPDLSETRPDLSSVLYEESQKRKIRERFLKDAKDVKSKLKRQLKCPAPELKDVLLVSLKKQRKEVKGIERVTFQQLKDLRDRIEKEMESFYPGTS